MKKYMIAVIVLVVGSWLVAEDIVMPKPIVGVEKVIVVPDDVKRHYTGRVESVSVIRIVSRIPGEVLEVGFNDGDLVKKGQMLYRIDPIQYEAAVKKAEAQISEWKAKLMYAQKSFNRNNLLYDKKATSLDSVENIQANLEVAKAGLLAAEAELITATDNYEHTVIRAPQDGFAGVTKFTPGNYISLDSGVLVTIIQVQPIRVLFSVSMSDYLSFFGSMQELKENGIVRIKLADGSFYPEIGEVELLNNEVNSKTDSVQIYAKLKNEDMRLIPGGTVTVTLSGKQCKMLPSVPLQAVMHDGLGAYVYIVDNTGKAERRDVVPARTTPVMQLVREGLTPGELVVVKGTHKVVAGADVDPTGK